jgi:hypothetical protein
MTGMFPDLARSDAASSNRGGLDAPKRTISSTRLPSTGSSCSRNPTVARLDVGSIYGSPGDPMRGLFLPKIAGMGGEGVIESLAIDILRMVGEMRPNRNVQIDVRLIWHDATGRLAHRK